MHQLAVYFLLLLTPVPGEAPATGFDCPEAREIAEMRPCLRPEECGAFDEWRQTFGEPGTVPLDPRSTAAVVRSSPHRWCLVGGR